MRSAILGVIILVIVLASGFFIYDLLFSKPEHLAGIIVEKIYVEGKLTSAATPYGGVKRSKYFITHQKDDQWIALVKTEQGDTLKVHCPMDHYEMKEVGDVMHFKKYDGHLVHIEYFAHNEEED
jgi:hypothetical protein